VLTGHGPRGLAVPRQIDGWKGIVHEGSVAHAPNVD
jgi:hypothetical protein